MLLYVRLSLKYIVLVLKQEQHTTQLAHLLPSVSYGSLMRNAIWQLLSFHLRATPENSMICLFSKLNKLSLNQKLIGLGRGDNNDEVWVFHISGSTPKLWPQT